MTESEEKSELPVAKEQVKKGMTKSWIVPVIVLAIIAYLMVDVFVSRGKTVTITFEQGHGLKAGDALKLRGIQIGSVSEIRLNEQMNQVEVDVQLNKSSNAIAKEDSLFWIVRPRVSIDEVDGLETLVGARYLMVKPGNGKQAKRFRGAEERPSFINKKDGDIEIVIQADARKGLMRGAPVVYRDMVIGEIVSMALSSDASAVEILVRIHGSYANLVRSNSVFWHLSGVSFDAGLSGLSMKIDSLASFLKGGIGVATPSKPGETVLPGHRFGIADKLDKDWLKFKPSLSVGTSNLPKDKPLPKLFGAEAKEMGKYIWSNLRSKRTWVLPIGEGVIAKKTVFYSDPKSDKATSALAIAGKEVVLNEKPIWSDDVLCYFKSKNGIGQKWFWNFVRPMTKIEDCLIVSGEGYPPIHVSTARLASRDDRIFLDQEMYISEDRLGSAVVAISDGFVVGLLMKEGKDFYIHKLPNLNAKMDKSN